MLRWLARLAVVVTAALGWVFVVSVASATPSRAPHANPTDIPDGSMAHQVLNLPVLAIGSGFALIAAYAAVALCWRRTN